MLVTMSAHDNASVVIWVLF